MKNKTTTFSIVAFMALALALTVPFTASAVEFVPVVDGSGSGTSESPIPAFTPSVDGSGSGTSESAIPAFVPTVDGSGSGTSEGSGSVFIPVVEGTGSSTSEGSGSVFVPIVDQSGSNTSEGDPLVFASATTTSTSTEVVTDTPVVTPVASVSRSGSSRSGGRSGVTVAPLAIADFAASTTCPYINSFITVNGVNDAIEVARLQSFLNTSEGASLAVTGIYDDATQNAVAVFQLKHSADILAPWNRTTASKNVYFTTKKKINELVCGGSFALTAAELAEIAAVRDALVNAPAGTDTATGVIGSASSTSTLAIGTSTGSTTNDNVAAAFFGGEFLGKFFRFIKGIFTGSN